MSKILGMQNGGSHEVLRTKLATPRLHASSIGRPALLARLDEGFRGKLTVLSAPAGFGKTTLVSEWLETFDREEERFLAAWVSLDSGDNDPVRFWSYVITACQKLQVNLGVSVLKLLYTPTQLSFERILTAFINELVELSGKHVLILDDYQVITSPQVHSTLTFLLDHLPSTLCVLIISRNDPPLPLARLRANNDLNEINADELRFTSQEIQSFFQKALALSLSTEAIRQLEARTEGWAAGLWLVALTLKRRRNNQTIEQSITNIAGTFTHILDYLTSEVFEAQPEAIQKFLLQTSFLKRLNSSLCDAVTGRNDSSAILEQLDHAHLFLIPLDDSHLWYRYHVLFAEAMYHHAQRLLGEDALRILCAKASRWYESQDLLSEAIETSLAAQEFPQAIGLIERILERRYFNNEVYTLRRWIEAIPRELPSNHPEICFAYAITLLFTDNHRTAATAAQLEVPLAAAERLWRAEGNRHKLGEAMAFRSLVAWWQGDFKQSFFLAKQALGLLPEQLPNHEMHWLGVSLINVALEALHQGNVESAEQLLVKVRILLEKSDNVYARRAALFVLGDLSIRQGKLHQAAQYYQQLYAEAGEDVDDQCHALIGLGKVALEWNNLETAEQSASDAIKIAWQTENEELILLGTLLSARCKYAFGDAAQAQRLLSDLSIPIQASKLHELREINAYQAFLALQLGNIATVERWQTKYVNNNQDIPLIHQEQEALIIARILVVQGKPDASLLLLESWRAKAEEQARRGNELEILILQAMSHSTQRNTRLARQTILRALTLGQTEEYCRLFLNEGETMIALLKDVLPHVTDTRLMIYIESLLQNAYKEPSEPSVITLNVVGLLTERERRVLRLLATDLSYAEIAAELVVSINTIKTQVKSIYRKLNIGSRDEAKEISRRLR